MKGRTLEQGTFENLCLESSELSSFFFSACLCLDIIDFLENRSFELKALILDSVRGFHYCVVTIDHLIYELEPERGLFIFY